jgi:hypothetical protein
MKVSLLHFDIEIKPSLKSKSVIEIQIDIHLARENLKI